MSRLPTKASSDVKVRHSPKTFFFLNLKPLSSLPWGSSSGSRGRRFHTMFLRNVGVCGARTTHVKAHQGWRRGGPAPRSSERCAPCAPTGEGGGRERGQNSRRPSSSGTQAFGGEKDSREDAPPPSGGNSLLSGGRPRPPARGAAATPRGRCRRRGPRRLDGPEGDGLGGGRAPQAPRRCPGPAAPDRRPAAAPSPPQGPRREPPPGTEPRPGALIPSRPGCPPSAPHGRRFCSWGNRPPRDQVPPGAKTRTQEFGAVGATGGGREWRRGAGPADRLLGP